MLKISGVYSAALTPLNNNMSINKDLFLRHCQYLMKQGHDGLAIFGTTGESNSLSLREKKENLEFLISNRLNPRVLIVGTGSSSLRDAIEMTKYSAENKVKAALILPPFYYKNVKDEGVINFYRYIIESVSDQNFHYILYNIPQNSFVPINFNIIEKLIKLYPNNVIGIKDSSGDSDYMLKIIKYFNEFSVFCGNDSLALKVCRSGGAGAITAGSNVSGKLLSFIINNYKKDKEIENFEKLQFLLKEIKSTLTSHEPISLMKAYFSLVDNIPEWNNVLPPLKNISDPKTNKNVILLKELIEKIDRLIPRT